MGRRLVIYGWFLALAALCASCGHASTNDADSQLMTAAPVAVALPVVEEVDRHEPIAHELRAQAVTITAEGEGLMTLDPDRPYDDGKWLRVRAGEAGSSKLTRNFGNALRDRHPLALAVDGRAPWARVVDLLNAVCGRRPHHGELRFAVGQYGGAPTWLDVQSRSSSRSSSQLEVGLAVTLLREDGARETRLEFVGSARPLLYGCDGAGVRRVRGWGAEAVAELRRCLDEALALVASPSYLRTWITAETRETTAAEVLALLAVLRERDVDEIDLGIPVHGRRRFMDASDDALRWLAAHQMPDGRWDAAAFGTVCDGAEMRHPLDERAEQRADDPGLTGHVLCAFLGAGYTNRGKHPFAKTVSRGLRHLKNMQSPEGCFGPAGQSWSARSHARASLAMGEAYGLTGSPLFKRAAQRGLDYLPQAFAGTDGSALTTAMHAAVLRSARLVNQDAVRRGKPAPLSVPDALESDLRMALDAVDLDAGDEEAAAALFAYLMLGDDPKRSRLVQQAVRGQLVRLAEDAAAISSAQWFLASCSLYIAGGAAWKTWSQGMQPHVNGRQRRDGHSCCYYGSWDARDADGARGRVEATTSVALATMVYYRYDRVYGSR